VVSMTDPCGRILGFLDRQKYYKGARISDEVLVRIECGFLTT
jgi:hypothetical protein